MFQLGKMYLLRSPVESYPKAWAWSTKSFPARYGAGTSQLDIATMCALKCGAPNETSFPFGSTQRGPLVSKKEASKMRCPLKSPFLPETTQHSVQRDRFPSKPLPSQSKQRTRRQAYARRPQKKRKREIKKRLRGDRGAQTHLHHIGDASLR